MLRSLNTAVTGVKAHQVRLDVIGNNIANVNTTGYKYSRVNFAESFAQTLKAGTAPSGTTGGTNPMLVGMGVQIQSIDCIHSQGALQQTDKDTDVALNGPGYFVLRDKSLAGMMSYTRNGDFGLNSNGYLITQDGLYVQGWRASEKGVINNFEEIGDIKLPIEEPLKPQATSEVKFGGNLYYPKVLDPNTAVANFFGSYIDVTQPASATGVYGATPGAGLVAGEFTINGVSIVGRTPDNTLKVPPGTAYDDLLHLADLINQYTPQTKVFATVKQMVGPDAAGAPPTGLRARLVLTSITPGEDSKIVIGGTARPTIGGVDVISVDPLHAEPNAITVTIETQTGGPPANTSRPSGQVQAGSINFAAGGLIINGCDIGALTSTPTTNTSEQNAQAIANLINAKTDIHGVTASTDGNGRLIFKAKARDIILSGTQVLNSANLGPPPSGANIGLYTGLNKARTATVYNGGSINVYNAMGGTHNINYYLMGDYNEIYTLNGDGTLSVTSTQIKNEWHWAASNNDPEVILDSVGEDGVNIAEHTIKFDDKGVLQSRMGNIRLKFKVPPPVIGGSEASREIYQPQIIKLNLGTPGKTDGVTQFMTPSTFGIIDQDGYATGNLISFNIGADGVIKGVYDNGKTKTLAQLALANFINPSGLTRSGGNIRGSQTIFQETPNSGRARIGTALGPGFGELKAGTLESSNVDLTTQFTDMIVTQRGFQANGRVITTSDEILQEVVHLKR